MEQRCDGGKTSFVMETIIIGGVILFLLWWWKRSQNVKVTFDKAVNTEGSSEMFQNAPVCHNPEATQTTNTKKHDETSKVDKYSLADNEKLSTANFNFNWKAVWVGDEKMVDVFSNRHRSELCLDLDTGHVTRKYEVIRHRNTHVIAAL